MRLAILFLCYASITYALTSTSFLNPRFVGTPTSYVGSTQMKKFMTGSSSSSSRSKRKKIIISGAPASGKGTQCERIKEQFGCIHLSTGDILRGAVKDGTPLGIQAKEFMDAGKLVPDELIIDVVCDRLKQDDCIENGWLLDGFPRTKSQADALAAAGMIPDCFVLLDVPEEILIERVTGRRTDPDTGKIYHMTYSPPPADIVDRLTQRSDDTAEKVSIRYQDFTSNINAIKSSYEDKMVWVDGTMAPDDVSDIILESLNNVYLNKADTGQSELSKPSKTLTRLAAIGSSSSHFRSSLSSRLFRSNFASSNSKLYRSL